MRSLILRLYVLNYALLMAHEIDSAYWQEWNLFGIPGGIQVFVVLNFALLLLGALGLLWLEREQKAGWIMSYILGGAGVFAFGIHTFFILTGHPEFTLPVSLILLGAILAVSIAQIIVTARALKPTQRKQVTA